MARNHAFLEDWQRNR